jgi:arsenate reductase
MTQRPRVLFLCTHNSARSQMAEGLLRELAGDRFEVHSAGTEATEVRPEAIAAMAEIGIDITGQASKTLEPYLEQRVDWLITVCDQAREACPVLPGVRDQLHWSIPDPAAVQGDGRLPAFRDARDDLRARIAAFVAERRAAEVAPPPESV